MKSWSWLEWTVFVAGVLAGVVLIVAGVAEAFTQSGACG
jgi:hypothetical protein